LDIALTLFNDYYNLSKELYEANPKNVYFKNGLAISYSKFADIYTRKSEKDKARSNLLSAEKHWAELFDAFPDYVEFKKNFTWVRESLEKLR